MEIPRNHALSSNYLVTQSATSQAITVSAALAAFKKNPNATFSIADSTTNIAKNLDALKLLGDKVTAIAQTGTPAVLALKATSAVANSSVLSKISNTYTLSLTGTISEIGLVSSDNHIASIQVNDSSANALSNLSVLKGYKDKLKTIALTDSTSSLSLTADQINTYVNEIAKITSANMINATNVSVSQMSGILANKKIATISVVDNSTNIANGLDALQKVASKIKTASISGDSDELSITTKQLASNAAIIGKITSGYHLALRGALVADALKYKSDIRLNSVAVVDTSANIAKNIDALNTLGDKLSGVTQSGKPTALTLTATQINSDATVLNKISEPYSISVSGNISDVKKIIANSKLTAVTLTDSMSNIQNNLDVLTANKGKITIISLTDKAPVFTLSANNIDANTEILNKIKTNYSIKATDVSYANLSKYSSNSKITSLELKDSVSYLQYASLSKNSKISNFKVNDATYAQSLLLNGNSKVTEIGIKDSSTILNQKISNIVKNKKIKSINLTDLGNTGLTVKEFNTYAIGKQATKLSYQSMESTQIYLSNGAKSIFTSNLDQPKLSIGYFDTSIQPSSQYPVVTSGNLENSIFIYQNGRQWGATLIDKNGNVNKLINDRSYPGTDFLSQSYVDNKNLYVGFNNGAGIIKYDLNGGLNWSASSPGWTTGIAVDDEGNVYTNNDQGIINKYNGEDGSLIWSKGGPVGQGWQGQGLAFSNGTLYTMNSQTYSSPISAYAFSKNGDIKWTTQITNDGQQAQGIVSLTNGNSVILQTKNDKNITFLDKDGKIINEAGFNTWITGEGTWRDYTRFSVYNGSDNTVIASGLGYKTKSWAEAADISIFISQYDSNGNLLNSAVIPLAPRSSGDAMYSSSVPDKNGDIYVMGMLAGDNYFGPSPSSGQSYFFRAKVSSGALSPPTININSSDYFGGIELLKTIPSSTNIKVTDANIGQISDILTNSMVEEISILDTADNIVNNLDTLQAANVVGSITVSDSMDLNITSDQQANYADVLSKLTGNPTINIVE